MANWGNFAEGLAGGLGTAWQMGLKQQEMERANKLLDVQLAHYAAQDANSASHSRYYDALVKKMEADGNLSGMNFEAPPQDSGAGTPAPTGTPAAPGPSQTTPGAYTGDANDPGWTTLIGAESGGDPAAFNKKDGGGQSVGVTQIHSQNWGDLRQFAKAYNGLDVPENLADEGTRQALAKNPQWKDATLAYSYNKLIKPTLDHIEASFPQLDTKNPGVRAMAFSLANQFGPGGAKTVLSRALDGVGQDAPLTPVDFIDRVNAERAREGGPTGLAYFPRQGPEVIPGLKKRFVDEASQLRALATKIEPRPKAEAGPTPAGEAPAEAAPIELAGGSGISDVGSTLFPGVGRAILQGGAPAKGVPAPAPGAVESRPVAEAAAPAKEPAQPSAAGAAPSYGAEGYAQAAKSAAVQPRPEVDEAVAIQGRFQARVKQLETWKSDIEKKIRSAGGSPEGTQKYLGQLERSYQDAMTRNKLERDSALQTYTARVKAHGDAYKEFNTEKRTQEEHARKSEADRAKSQGDFLTGVNGRIDQITGLAKNPVEAGAAKDDRMEGAVGLEDQAKNSALRQVSAGAYKKGVLYNDPDASESFLAHFSEDFDSWVKNGPGKALVEDKWKPAAIANAYVKSQGVPGMARFISDRTGMSESASAELLINGNMERFHQAPMREKAFKDEDKAREKKERIGGAAGANDLEARQKKEALTGDDAFASSGPAGRRSQRPGQGGIPAPILANTDPDAREPVAPFDGQAEAGLLRSEQALAQGRGVPPQAGPDAGGLKARIAESGDAAPAAPLVDQLVQFVKWFRQLPPGQQASVLRNPMASKIISTYGR